MTKKKNALSRYPRLFFSELVFKTVSWIIFAILFVNLGKSCLEIDMVGKIYSSIFGKNRSFNHYFLGADVGEKNILLNYAMGLLIVIIVLNVISLWLNSYLWKKDRYIENNNYYLHDRRVFIINSLIHVAGAFLLAFSFVSILTLTLTFLFISFNTWCSWSHRKLKKPGTESFFSWKNEYVRKITFYSIIVLTVIPFFLGRVESFFEKATSSSPTGLAKAFSGILNAFPPLRAVIRDLLGTGFNLDFFFWFILIWFGRGLIINRVKEFGDFWLKVNNISKQVNNFRHHYYYQESWAQANGTLINLGDYRYLENGPHLLSKSYLESDLDVDNFAKQNKKVVKYIEFCEDKVKETPKKNFLNYCLFNEFSSWEDCLRTKKLIQAARK